MSNAAQMFTPQNFWKDRLLIARTMLEQIYETLWRDGHVHAVRVQILIVDFAAQFENAITHVTQVQVAEQQRVKWSKEWACHREQETLEWPENLGTLAQPIRFRSNPKRFRWDSCPTHWDHGILGSCLAGIRLNPRGSGPTH